MGMSEPAGHLDHPNRNGWILFCHTAGAIDQPYVARLEDVYIGGSGHTFAECSWTLIDQMRKITDEFEQAVIEKYGNRPR